MTDIDSERELVTVLSFRELSQAMLAKGMLNSAGIECFLVDDNTGRMLGFISNVIGGIRMKVHRVDADAAIALLEQPIPKGVDVADEGNDQPPRSPKCSPRISSSTKSTILCLPTPGSACLCLFMRGCVSAGRAAINGTTMTML